MSSATVQSNTNRKSSSEESGPSATMKSKPNAWSKPLQPKTPEVADTTDATAPSSNDKPPPQSHTTTATTKKSKASLSTSPKSSPPNLTALRERFLHSFLQLTGQSVSVTMDSGIVYQGVLHTATPFAQQPQQYVLKAATGGDVNPGSTIIIRMEQVVHLHGIATAPAAGFLDAEIAHSAKSAGGGGGSLVQADAVWTQESTASNTKTTSKFRLGHSIAGWDQFQANEQLFNVKGGFDESVYTTVLDTTKVSATDQSKAARLAQEIQSAPHLNNFHIAEERNQVLPGAADLDEEDRFSGVLAPKLNYAQAAGKKLQEAAAEAAAPSAVETKEVDVAAASPAQSVTPKAENTAAAKEDKPAAVDAESKPTSDEADAPAKSKLNANAKEFSLSGAAPPFVPPPPPQPAAAYLPPQPFAIDPNTGMPIPILQQMPMQPGMMHPMMHPMQYGMGYRYPPDMMMHQPPPPAANSGGNDDGSGNHDQQPPPPQPEGHPPPPMHFHPPHPHHPHHQGYHYPPPPPQNFVRYPVYNNNGYDGNRRGGGGRGRGRGGRGRNGSGGRGGRGRGDHQQQQQQPPPLPPPPAEENGEAPRADK